MSIEMVKEAIREYIPEILRIPNRSDRIDKCISLIDSDNIIELLEKYRDNLQEYDNLKDEDWNVDCCVQDILQICNCCAGEYLWRKVPLYLDAYASYGGKLSLLNIQIGDTLSNVRAMLERYGIKESRISEGNYIELDSDILLSEGECTFKMQIHHNGDTVVGFYLYKEYASDKGSVGRWHTLASINDLFGGCYSTLEECNKERIVISYTTGYENIEVIHYSYETRIHITKKG